MTAHLKPHTFGMLDGIRGLAALVVAQRHLAHYFFNKQLPGSYLAVDIFFVLSGFVIAHAYEPRFAKGMRPVSFLAIRVIRLWPLYLAGTLLGLLTFYLSNGMDISLLTIVPTLFFLPRMGAFSADAAWTMYPLDYPVWTLLFELFVNLLHVLLASRLTNGVLHFIIALSAVLLIAATFTHGYLDVGYHPADYFAGIPRVCFSYFLGVRLYRHWQARSTHAQARSWPVLLGILLVMFLPVPPEYRSYYDLLAVLIFIPALVYAGASVTLGYRSAQLLLPLGAASYACYVLHVPFGRFCARIAAYAGVDLPTFYEPWSGVGVLVALLALSLILGRYYDLPLRQWLTRTLLQRA